MLNLITKTESNWGSARGRSYRAYIIDGLEELGANPNPDKVDELFGYAACAVGSCNECGEESEELVQLGEEPEYESRTANVCAKCLMKAMILINP